MKRLLASMIFLICISTMTTVFAETSVAEQRKQIDKLSTTALEKLYEKYPNSKQTIKNSYAYATLSNSGLKIVFLGSSHGRGVAINNKTGEKVYIRIKELSTGLGLGAKEYNLIFIINNREAWENFIIGKTRFSTSAEMSANDGVNGGTIEGMRYVAPNVYVYQMTTKGLSIDLALKGTKIYKDKKLNS